jgi:glyoxylase-like metal-dependent hydrolase (beta-lactamase superfamily II)
MIETHELIKGLVYRMRIPMDVEPGYVYSYIVRSGDGCVMIDAGYPNRELVKPLIDSIRKVPNCRLDALIITHMHIDHYGLMNEIRNALGAYLVMHINDYEQLVKMGNTEQLIREMAELLREWGVFGEEEQLLMNVIGRFSRRRASLGDLRLDKLIRGDEESIDELRVVLTPGHSPGHVSVVFSEYSVAFTGDLILPTITTHVGLSPINLGNPLLSYIKSLMRIRSMKLKCVHPGHEHEVCNVDDRIGELISHRVSRLCEVIKILSNKPSTVFEIASTLRWMDNREYSLLDPMNKYLAITETASLVKYLEELDVIGRNYDGRYEVIRGIECNQQLLIPQQ